MQVDLKQLKKIVEFCRKQGVCELKTGDFQISLSPSALFPEKKHKPEAEQPIPSTQGMSEEDILLWSSAGLTEGEVQQ